MTSEPVSETAPKLLGVRILVVDDDQDTLDLECFVLQQHGAQVECVTTVQEALAAITRQPPSLVISDLAMPVDSGLDLIRRLRAEDDEDIRSLPVLALSAHASDISREQALEAGFDMFLTKPIEPDRLVETVQKLSHLDDEATKRAE
jgi:CheY-like chemotaxis protein